MKKFMKKMDRFVSIGKKACKVLLTLIDAYETMKCILA